MRKEVIFAVLVGALIGVFIIIGIKRLNTSEPVEKVSNEQINDSNDPSNSDQDSPTAIFLAISRPDDKDVITTNPAVISGISLANSWVVLMSEADDQITRTNEKGEFNFEIELSGGINKLKLSAFDKDGKKATKELTLVYTSQLENE